jgi:prefoldin subunit 5
MNWVLWIYAVSALASAFAAVLAWAAKLWWAKEFSSAKDEIIKAKDAQIERLKGEIDSVRGYTGDIVKAKDTQIESLKNEIQSIKEMTPMKIREYFHSVKEQLEEYIDKLKRQLDEANKQIEEKSEEINALHALEERKKENVIDIEYVDVDELVTEKQELEEKALSIKDAIQQLNERKVIFTQDIVDLSNLDWDSFLIDFQKRMKGSQEGDSQDNQSNKTDIFKNLKQIE